MRIGIGFDAHQLVEGRSLILGGVTIPHKKGLLGHSDADVLTHTIMDALLGALALGSIGDFFPDTDSKYKDISSLTLLDTVTDTIKSKGYCIANIDSVIVAQKPKLQPYITDIRQTLAHRMNINIDQVGVKATTTEKLGYEGEELGISAKAVVLLNTL
ncbi:MAG: 2-C-methyl-D-erythritol 2,4-cyclodiphosphate synthase [Candidatus Margulisbacteria bacterium]|nr:2-C-methyl-D-erythritol 2,4-cyclodiphosphate synthase [Candidatus Margulisiibacteriota bacterium]